jgi:hypothetical protein
MEATCEICWIKFNNRSSKYDHKLGYHFGGVDCDLCVKNYRRRSNLMSHYVSKHGKRLDKDKDYCKMSKQDRDKMVEDGM